MENRNCFALLVAVGDYSHQSLINLPTYRNDLELMKSSLISGVKMPPDNIRMMPDLSDNGTVSLRSFAKALSEFQTLLMPDDTLFFYFSGHGGNKNIIFSDGAILLQSVIDYLAALDIKCKIAIFDCCEAGAFSTSSKIEPSASDYISDYVGTGMQVLSATSANEFARLGPGGLHSLFTGALSIAFQSPTTVKKGRRSLSEVCDYARYIIANWNKQTTAPNQSPVFRSNIVGNVFFEVSEKEEYRRQNVYYEAEDYTVTAVTPLHSVEEKRLCAFVTTKALLDNVNLAECSQKIIKRIKNVDVFSNEQSERRFKGKTAKAIWCYFGLDESDMASHTFYAHTVWADDDVKGKYFRHGKNDEEINGVNICWNSSYKMLRAMREAPPSRAEYIQENKELSSAIIGLAERFISDLDSFFNQELSTTALLDRYGLWIQSIHQKYLKLSDMNVPPDDLREWADEILSMVGFVLDISLMLKTGQSHNDIDDRELWLIKNAISNYYQSLERLKAIESNANLEANAD